MSGNIKNTERNKVFKDIEFGKDPLSVHKKSAKVKSKSTVVGSHVTMGGKKEVKVEKANAFAKTVINQTETKDTKSSIDHIVSFFKNAWGISHLLGFFSKFGGTEKNIKSEVEEEMKELEIKVLNKEELVRTGAGENETEVNRLKIDIINLKKQMNDIIDKMKKQRSNLSSQLEKFNTILFELGTKNKVVFSAELRTAKNYRNDLEAKLTQLENSLEVNENYRNEAVGKPDDVELLQFQIMEIDEQKTKATQDIDEKIRILKRKEKKQINILETNWKEVSLGTESSIKKFQTSIKSFQAKCDGAEKLSEKSVDKSMQTRRINFYNQQISGAKEAISELKNQYKRTEEKLKEDIGNIRSSFKPEIEKLANQRLGIAKPFDAKRAEITKKYSLLKKQKEIKEKLSKEPSELDQAEKKELDDYLKTVEKQLNELEKEEFTTIRSRELKIEGVQNKIAKLLVEKIKIQNQLKEASNKLLKDMVFNNKAEQDTNSVKKRLDKYLADYKRKNELNLNKVQMKELDKQLRSYKEKKIKELDKQLEQRKHEIRQQAAKETIIKRRKYRNEIKKIDKEIKKLEREIKGLEGSNE